MDGQSDQDDWRWTLVAKGVTKGRKRVLKIE